MTYENYAQILIDATPGHKMTMANYEMNSADFKVAYNMMKESNDEDHQADLFNKLLDLLGFEY